MANKKKTQKISPSIKDYDLNRFIRNIQKWIDGGDTAEAVVTFKGREGTHPEIGKVIIDMIMADLKDYTVQSKRTDEKSMACTFIQKKKN